MHCKNTFFSHIDINLHHNLLFFMKIYSLITAFRYYFAANLIVIPFFTKLYHYTTIFTTELHQIK